MLGLVFDRGRVELRDDLPEPRPAPGETRVAVVSAGICATDLALARGYMDFSGVPGHEFVGRALDGPLAGRRVVGEINAAHGVADPRHAPGRTVLGIAGRAGAFAERLSLPTANLHAVPDGVRSDAATFVEPLAAACRIVEQLPVGPGTRALVAGDGRLGLLCAHVLHLAGAAVTVAGRHADHARLLPAGVSLVTGWLEPDAAPPEPGGLFDLAVEATGRPDVLARLLPRMAPLGTLVLKTTSERAAPLDLSPAVVNELRLQGSRCGPFEPALRLLAEHAVPVERLVTARYPLRAATEALRHAARPGALKILLDVAADES